MPRYIRDVIDLPGQVHRGDFVLRLTEGVQHPEQTVADYVVTPQLAEAFDNALGFIKSALQPPSSKATYLHGSFGSGKSHFMAVLHLLLKGDPNARGIPELAAMVAKHNEWTEGRKFLLIPYHMIGARTMESAILGHYVEHVRAIHPDASLPGVYLAESVFADAVAWRKRMGDAAFFAELNAGTKGSGGWGDIGAAWDASNFETAIAAPPNAESRTRLVGDLVDRLFTAFRDVASATDEAYVPLDQGLSVISKHASGLGYDAVILFLDELILWLASHAGDQAFVSREGQKLAKLVEAQSADRPIPLVSFVARQRDLRDLVGEHVTGAEQLAFGDVLKWWDARFHTITLEDRNLPVIAERRILKPKSAAARQELDEAFRETANVRQEVMDTLLTSTANRDMFRQVYPFSPALVQALVAVSSLLQRERTALKVMLQLLVEQRDTLKVGDVVPVGDLFDAITQGEEAINEGMKIHFENARRLYHRKLRPMLEREHSLTAEELKALPSDDPRAAAFRANDRLLKTLLLSALVPEVEALKALTPTRLAALNHGTIRTPIPGREAQEVQSRLRRWAAQVGEIKLPDDTNPIITVQLTGVDTESIIEQARNIDNVGNRQIKIRELLFKELGVEDSGGLFPVHEFEWLNTERSCEVRYANVREMPDDALRPSDDGWRVVIDYPFDAEGKTPKDDLARLEQFAATNEECQTLVWIPAFLSRDSLRDLGTLVVLDHILTGERFLGYATMLQPADRAQARQLLENQQSQLRNKLKITLEGAYGIAAPQSGSIDQSHELSEHFQTLDGWQPEPPVGANLASAFQHLLGQAFAHQFPAHPQFEAPIRLANLRKVWDVVRLALDDSSRRVAVDRPLRPIVRGIAVPLKLADMGETHFVLRDTWTQHFLQQHAVDGGGPITVGKLRRWIDRPHRMGLSENVQNLLILTFAEQTGRTFFLHGGPFDAALDRLPDEVELRQQLLPTAENWVRARQRAAALFGYTDSALLSVTNVNSLVTEVRRQATEKRTACRELVGVLAEKCKAMGVDPTATNRARTASAAAQIVEALAAAVPDQVVDVLVNATVVTSDAAVSASIKKAPVLVETLNVADWRLFDAIGRLTDDRQTAAQGIRRRIGNALSADEYVTPLAGELKAAQSDAVELLAQSTTAPPTFPPPSSDRKLIEASKNVDLSASEAADVFSHLGRLLREDKRRRLTVDWQVNEEPDA